MYDPQHLVDLQDNSGFAGDPNSWLSGADHSLSPPLNRTNSSLSNATATGTSDNLHRVLFNDLVEMFPLVQHLIDRKASSSFTRRGSMVYTKTPSRESLAKKATEAKGRNPTESIPAKKRRDPGDKDHGKSSTSDQDSDSFPHFSSRAMTTEDREELIKLREQVEDLHGRILEKDELLKSAEASKDQITFIHTQLDELKNQATEKEMLLKSTQLQLSDAKIKLADKQATLEKVQWEAMTSNKRVEKLQEDLDNMQAEISSFMLFLEEFAKNDARASVQHYDVTSYFSDHIPVIDDLDETEMQKMEEASEAYAAAVTTAREKQDEESIEAAAAARLYLQSYLLEISSINTKTEDP